MRLKRETAFIFKYIKKYLPMFIGGSILISAGTLLSLLIPELLKWFIDASIMGDKLIAARYLVMLVLISILIYIIKGICFYFKERLIAFAVFGTMNDIRLELFKRSRNLPYMFFKQKRTGDFSTAFTAGIQPVEEFLLNTLPEILSRPVAIFGLMTLLFFTSWKLAFFSLAVFPVILFVSARFGKASRRFSAEVQKSIMELSSTLIEFFNNIRIVRIFGREESEFKRFGHKSSRLAETSVKGIKATALSTPVIELLSCAALVIFFWYGGIEIINGNLSPGDLIKFVTCITMLLPYLKNISTDFIRCQKMMGALDNTEAFFRSEILDDCEETASCAEEPADMDSCIAGYYDGKSSKEECCYKEECSNKKERCYNEECRYKEERSNKQSACDIVQEPVVCFENVSFSFPGDGKKVLDSLSFCVNNGERLIIAGRNGAGKSTLINLLAGLLKPDSGKIDIKGMNGYKQNGNPDEMSRQLFAFIPQEQMLFNETVRYNIAYGKQHATMEEIKRAAEKANAAEFIEALPGKYDNIIADKGERLSAGQRQRISIARAIITDPVVVIMDEASASLDAESEKLSSQALDEFAKGRILFMITHRLSEIKETDKVLFLDKGGIHDFGSHNELYKRNSKYRKIYRLSLT